MIVTRSRLHAGRYHRALECRQQSALS
jgi:hypothetical protein